MKASGIIINAHVFLEGFPFHWSFWYMTDIKLLRLAASLDRCQVEYPLQRSTRCKGRPAANLDSVDSLQGGSLARRGLAARLGPAAKVNLLQVWTAAKSVSLQGLDSLQRYDLLQGLDPLQKPDLLQFWVSSDDYR